MEPTRLSAGVVVVRRAEGRRHFLLLRAYRNWDFPKGMVEAGEDPLDAAIREVREETGIADLAFDWGREFRETPPYAKGKVARLYLAETATESVVLGPNPAGIREHQEARWVEYQPARALLVPRLQTILDWAEERMAS